MVKPPIFEDDEHALRGEIDVGRELVGVPAEQQVARVGVDRAERSGGGGDFQLVLHRVAGERGVVGLEVELEVLEEVVLAQEVQAGRGVGIVLVLGRFLRLGLDVELAGEADLLCVVDGHVQELREVVELALHVGVPQSRDSLRGRPRTCSLRRRVPWSLRGPSSPGRRR